MTALGKNHLCNIALLIKPNMTPEERKAAFESHKEFVTAVNKRLEREGKAKTFEEALKASLNVGVKIKRGNGEVVQTAVMVAAEAGDVELLQLFKQHGAKLEVADNQGRTAVHYAAFRGHREAVRYLCVEQKNIDTPGFSTPLMWAVRQGHSLIVKDLVEEFKCDVNADTASGETVIFHAMLSKSRDEMVAKFLSRTKAEHLKKEYLIKTAQSEEKVTLLVLAAKLGSSHLVKQLCESEAKIDKANVNKAFHAAITSEFKDEADQIEALKTLLAQGADITTAKKLHGLYPKNKAVLKFLLENGANACEDGWYKITFPEGEFRDLLLVAIHNNDLEMVTVIIDKLLEKGSDEQARNSLDKAVHKCLGELAKKVKPEIVTKLLKAGANPFVQAKDLEKFFAEVPMQHLCTIAEAGVFKSFDSENLSFFLLWFSNRIRNGDREIEPLSVVMRALIFSGATVYEQTWWNITRSSLKPSDKLILAQDLLQIKGETVDAVKARFDKLKARSEEEYSSIRDLGFNAELETLMILQKKVKVLLSQKSKWM